ncbi:disease resistance protein RPM1-like [Triticum urartu]|nr:disease resistance protein RPM1-like [Triticum urartu]XP_048553989.1 disease resistance protein RPM1-like [Triticum urartu]XP_048553990.1 disease resistance protein RPM1-like [Triticum urartu]XP_048553991.1 disease resistance protein RPM1-like [Triticum urartu]XP_048553992.1 disease resistance protein RPM1-like [Triticum urartu]XP_048553993.1 disease resistance protein RPM1-like [Triticum urartu]XP_048553994.1 disease resistance protein RPM1-like [Triticum urartu]XP_048553995.1 disease re
MKIDSGLGYETAKAIISKLSYNVTNLKELPVKFEEIKKILKMLSNVIRQIGMVSLMDEVVKSWIGEVRSVAYHVEDTVDKYSYHILQYQEEGPLEKFFTKRTHYVKVFSEIVDDVAKVEREILLVIEMKGRWLQPSQLVADPLIEMERQWFQYNCLEVVKYEDLVGIADNMIFLTGLLYSEEQETTVITVSGMGGLGKSTLVSNVYEREKINFHAHAWIVVSQIYTVDALLRTLISKIGYIEQPLPVGIEKMDVHDLKNEIKQRLQNRKYLIVLDDVWFQDVYFQIHDALQDFQGSRIIITTRKDHVAGISSPAKHLELQPLSHPDAFDLFCRRAFYQTKGNMCPNELETIATYIVGMCHGLPLAIVTIASMLSSKLQLDFWNQTYNQIGRVLSNNDHVRAILNLSFYDLSEDLRCCFMYCSLFPEDYPMSRDGLVWLWVSEGLVVSRKNHTPEMIAEGNLMELIHRNMLEVVENDELGRVKTCKMHAIVRELAISVAEVERFASANEYGTLMEVDKDVRHLSLCEWKDDSVLEIELPHLRTVVSIGGISSSPGLLSSILSRSSYLAVLELQDSEVSEVPTLIGHLFNLRYFGLRRTKVKSLPDSIQNLSNLYTLDIKQTKIEKLPRGVVKLKKLCHLLADRSDEEMQTEFPYFIGVPTPEKLSNLDELQTLETVKSSNGLAEQLKKLMQLRSVSIENIRAADCANLFATLSDMPLLSRLILSARDENEALCFEDLKPRSADLHRLIIRGQLAKGTLNCPIFLHLGTRLKYLALSWCDLGENPLKMLAPSLLNLAYLELSNMHTANTMVISEDDFPNLKTLVLKHMPDVKGLSIIDGALPGIESLYITSLPKMDMVPRGIEALHSLKKLWLLDLHKNFISKWISYGMQQKMLHVPEVRI